MSRPPGEGLRLCRANAGGSTPPGNWFARRHTPSVRTTRKMRTNLAGQRLASPRPAASRMRMMRTNPDVLVIGGGVIGLTSAYLLAKSGLTVEVVDKGEMGREASWAGAGILPPWGDGEYATPLDQLRAYSVSRFEALSRELRVLTGIDNEYHVCGGVEFLSEVDADIPDLWRREGVPFERYTGVRPTGTIGYRLPFAQVRNPRHLKALVEACGRVGVTVFAEHASHRVCLDGPLARSPHSARQEYSRRAVPHNGRGVVGPGDRTDRGAARGSSGPRTDSVVQPTPARPPRNRHPREAVRRAASRRPHLSRID